MSGWLPAVLPEAGLRLFCFPHAGVGASAYRAWPDLLPKAEIGVCPVQLPGRENRLGEPAARDVGQLVDALFSEVADRLDRPFALFGHSLGALVAFEFARLLRDRGAPLPVHLFVSGRIAPQLADPREKLNDLPDAGLRARLAELGGIPSAVLDDPDLLTLLLPLLRADLAVNENYRYRPGPPLPVPITAFGGARDPKVSAVELRAWAEQTSGQFTDRMLPGGHFFVQESVRSLLGHLVTGLSRSPVEPPPGGAWALWAAKPRASALDGATSGADPRKEPR